MAVTISLNGHDHVFPDSQGWRVESDGMLSVKEGGGEEQFICASFRNWDYALLNRSR